jgi:hypothetical protein
MIRNRLTMVALSVITVLALGVSAEGAGPKPVKHRTRHSTRVTSGAAPSTTTTTGATKAKPKPAKATKKPVTKSRKAKGTKNRATKSTTKPSGGSRAKPQERVRDTIPPQEEAEDRRISLR